MKEKWSDARAHAEIYEKNLKNPAETFPKIAQLAEQITQGCVEGYRKHLGKSRYH